MQQQKEKQAGNPGSCFQVRGTSAKPAAALLPFLLFSPKGLRNQAAISRGPVRPLIPGARRHSKGLARPGQQSPGNSNRDPSCTAQISPNAWLEFVSPQKWGFPVPTPSRGCGEHQPGWIQDELASPEAKRPWENGARLRKSLSGARACQPKFCSQRLPRSLWNCEPHGTCGSGPPLITQRLA